MTLAYIRTLRNKEMMVLIFVLAIIAVASFFALRDSVEDANILNAIFDVRRKISDYVEIGKHYDLVSDEFYGRNDFCVDDVLCRDGDNIECLVTIGDKSYYCNMDEVIRIINSGILINK